MSNESNRQSITIGSKLLSYPQLLTILFVLLKVFGKVTWPWILVFSPLWIPVAVFLGVVFIGAVVLGTAFAFDAWYNHKGRKAQAKRLALRRY